MGRKFRGLCPPFGEGAAESPSNTKSPGPRPSSMPSGILIHAAICSQQIWAENWGAVPLLGRGAGSPSNTMWPGPKPTCMPSFILIRPTVWPQCTNVTDRQTDIQLFDSIGRTVFTNDRRKNGDAQKKRSGRLGRMGVRLKTGRPMVRMTIGVC